MVIGIHTDEAASIASLGINFKKTNRPRQRGSCVVDVLSECATSTQELKFITAPRIQETDVHGHASPTKNQCMYIVTD